MGCRPAAPRQPYKASIPEESWSPGVWDRTGRRGRRRGRPLGRAGARGRPAAIEEAALVRLYLWKVLRTIPAGCRISLQTMQHLIRRLFKSPMFTGITLLTLAIGIGANTAVFSVVEGVLLKPLPYPRPDELISVKHRAPGIKVDELPVSPSCYFVYREEAKSFQDIGLWTNHSVSATGLSEPEQLDSIQVTD